MRGIGLLLLLAVLANAEEWCFPRGDHANSGVVKNRGPRTTPTVQWERDEEGTVVGGAALADGRVVYGAGEFTVVCRSERTGVELWKTPVKQQVVAWPCIRDDLIYFGSPDTVHYILRLNDGKEAGAPEAGGGIVATPLVTGELYVAGSLDGKLYAMDPKSGRGIWSVQTGAVRHGAVYERGRIYVANETGVLYALEADRGREVWHREAGAEPRAAPLLTKGAVLLPVGDRLLSFATKDGRPGAPIEAQGLSGAPALDKTTLYYGTSDGEVVILDLKRGKELGRTKVAEAAVTTPLTVASRIVYGAAGATLFALDAKSARLLWTFEGAAPFAPPIVAGGSLYAGCGTSFLCLR